MLLDDEKLNNGFIRLWRSLVKWEWYTEVNTFKLFIHLLLKANFQKKEWRGITIDRGSLITSIQNLSKETGLSKQNVRTAIKNLVLTHEITHRTTNHYSIISIKNYDLYQSANTLINTQITHAQHTPNTRLTTTNNDNNDNNDNNEEEVVARACTRDYTSELKNVNNSENAATSTSTNDISDLNPDRIKDLQNWYGEYSNVHLTKEQYNRLEAYVLNNQALNEIINELSENIARKKALPYDEKSPFMHYATLKRYWQYKYQNCDVSKDKTKVQKNDYKQALNKIFEEMESKNK